MAGQFRTAHDEADLRAVAVRDGDIPPVLDELGDVLVGLRRCVVLILHRLVLGIGDEGVPSDCDDDLRHGYSITPMTEARSAMRITTPL